MTNHAFFGIIKRMKNDLPHMDIISQAVEVMQLRSRNQSLLAENDALKTLAEKLTLENARLLKLLYGAKTEKMTPEQKVVFEEVKEEDLAAKDQIETAVTHRSTPKSETNQVKKPARHALPEQLKRVEIIHQPTVEGIEDITQSDQWVHIGDEFKEELDIIPAQFFVNRHRYPKYAHRTTGQVICALRDAAIIDGGYASSNLLSWVAVSKYVDHLPLYRIAQIAERDGVTLSRSTLADWIGRIGIAMMPVFSRLKCLMQQRDELHADETPVSQLNPQVPNKSHRSYLWVYRTNPLDGQASHLIAFDYQTSRAGEHARTFLSDFSGHLMVDDYAGYKALFKRTENPVIELACWAHARRKFFELSNDNQNEMAKSVLDQIAQLYRIETDCKDMSRDDRLKIRQAQAIPILDQLHRHLLHNHHILAPSSNSAKAVNYTLKRWAALIRYAETGHLPIDNNPAENAIRPIALGRKNWLFVGSESAGKRQTAIISLLATAKANGINPDYWLRDTLARLPTTKDKDIDTLLPIKGWCASG